MLGNAEPARIAIVGTGNIARLHARALLALDGTGPDAPHAAHAPHAPPGQLVAAMDTDDSQLRAFGTQFAVPQTYRRLADLLRDGQPDLVHVCTPPFTHYAVARDCLRAGVSVLVEKPPTISLREFDDLAAAAGGPGPPYFGTVFQHRFGSAQRRLKSLAASGLLGRPLLAVCHTTWFRDQAYFDVDWRGRWDTEGGGPTMGHGIHQMDMLLDILGEWTEVSAIARTQARRMATEDLSLAHVSFASGAVASVLNSVLSPRQESYLRFDFERATVEVSHLYGYRDDDWRVTPVPGWDQQVLAAWAGGPHGVPSGHAAQFAEVLAALRDGRRPPVGPDAARGTLALVAGIYASAFTRRPVAPADLGPGSPFYQRMNGLMDEGTPA